MGVAGDVTMNWKTARKKYEAGGISLATMAEKLNVTRYQLDKRRKAEGWKKGKLQTDMVTPVIKDEDKKDTDLTQKENLFCLHYVKSFNASQAAIKAGYSKQSSYNEGPRILKRPHVKRRIKELKGDLTDSLFLNAADVMNEYMKIAFADITDYITFDSYVRYERDEDGGIRLDDEDQPITYQVSRANFISSEEVDGTIITEVKQGKDGVSIKLADKMKALEKLEKYFDAFGDARHKRRIDNERLKVTQAEMQLKESEAAVKKDEEEMKNQSDNLEGLSEAIKASYELMRQKKEGDDS